MLPSAWSARRLARPLAVDAVHDQSNMTSRPAPPLSSPRGRNPLAVRLRWFLCGCGLLYVVLLWHTRLWTTDVDGGRAVATSMRAATPSSADATATLAVHVRAAVEGEATFSPPPFTDTPSTTTNQAATTTTTIPASIPPSSTSFTSEVDLEWLRSVVATTSVDPELANVAATTMPLSLQAHMARMQELEDSRRALRTTVDLLTNRLATVRVQLMRHAAVVANEEAKLVRPLPRGAAATARRLECVGWRATQGCGPHGPRIPANDRACGERVAASSAGYCEVLDPATQERFRVMETSCDSLRWDGHFSCADAPFFANFPSRADAVLTNSQSSQPPQPTTPTQGIVLVVYPKMLPSAYATLRVLRRLACTLPVELWYSPKELPAAATHPILREMTNSFGPVTLRAITDPSVKGFATKIHAIHRSAFDHVLFLDADNVPVKDPTYVFSLPQFRRTGALFWPDFWHPNHTIFAIHERSLVWEYLDLPFVDMFEQESGQLVVDKTRSQRAFELLELYASHRPNLFEKIKLVHGDKDLIRFAWIKSNTSFYMVEHPPGVAGNVIDDMFCGQTMAQFDPDGELLFLHRNARKLEGRHAKKPTTIAPNIRFLDETPAPMADDGETDVDPEIWTHLLQFKPTSTRSDYTIEIYKGSAKFPAGQWCYGKPSPAAPHFNAFRFADLPQVRTIESEIRAYAIEATDLLRKPKLRPDHSRGEPAHEGHRVTQ